MPSPPASFANLRVAAFESRRADDMTRLIERNEGVPRVSPSMREVAVEEDRPSIDFANRLITGQVDMVIFLTGVGIRQLLLRIERHVDKQRFLDSLADIKTVVRGPKPLAVLRELGIKPTLQVGEPNTWREILAALDNELPVVNHTVAVQEYGVSNVSLIAGLEARGAKVESVAIYRWALPEDLGPLEANIRRVVAGEVDIALFTAAQQVEHLLEVAQQMELEQELRQALRQVVIGSIGPTTSETLRERDFAVDFEPSHSKMGQLVSEIAQQSATLVAAKQSHSIRLLREAAMTQATEGSGKGSEKGAEKAWHNSVFMRACRKEKVPYTPIWLMRQAGRYMEEYREVRAPLTFLELCKNPQLCSEVMCTAVEKLGVDAAIIFSDLLPILEPMGLHLEFVAGGGPKIDNPVREASDIDRIIALENMDDLQFVVETVAQTRRDLPEALPLIGFAGAPFTLASYAIEGGSSRTFLHTKKMMYREPSAWRDLMQRLSHSITLYLNAQIEAGAQVVQLFDSWVGCLGPDDYRTYVMPHIQKIVAGLTPGTPLIHFGTGNPALLALQAEAGGEVIGVDWRIDLAKGWEAVGHDRAVQGNLDPMTLLADRKTIAARATEVLNAAGDRPGHIFNLGHGVLQQTPVENAQYLVDFVHEASSR